MLPYKRELFFNPFSASPQAAPQRLPPSPSAFLRWWCGAGRHFWDPSLLFLPFLAQNHSLFSALVFATCPAAHVKLRKDCIIFVDALGERSIPHPFCCGRNPRDEPLELHTWIALDFKWRRDPLLPTCHSRKQLRTGLFKAEAKPWHATYGL